MGLEMRKSRNPVLIVELLGLFVLMVFLTVVITGTLMTARKQSLYAKHLTEAVSLASDVAEVGMAAKDREEAFALYKQMEQVESADPGNGLLVMRFTDKSGQEDRYTVKITWAPEEDGAGRFTEHGIDVYYGWETEPIYTLAAGSYRKR